MKKKINYIKQIMMLTLFLFWTFLVIQFTYANTTQNAELISVTENGYEICYRNTGDIFTYK